jgi:hypothetical protein
MPGRLADRLLDGRRVSEADLRKAVASENSEEQYFAISYLLSHGIYEDYAVDAVLATTSDIDVACVALIYEARRALDRSLSGRMIESPKIVPRHIQELATAIVNDGALPPAFGLSLTHNCGVRIRTKVAVYLRYLGPVARQANSDVIWDMLINETDRTVRSSLAASIRVLVTFPKE